MCTQGSLFRAASFGRATTELIMVKMVMSLKIIFRDVYTLFETEIADVRDGGMIREKEFFGQYLSAS
jgi:hypothetical protein